jgi:hypothetical protein
MIDEAQEFLSGKKSYLLMAAGVIAALIAFSNGQEPLECLQLAIGSLGIGALRAGVAKAE